MKNLAFFLKVFCFILFLFIFPSCNNSQTEISNVISEEETSPIDSTTPVIETTKTTTCPWTRKREFECDGVTYIAGLPSCYIQAPGKSIFCKKEFENDIQACLNDSSTETQKCHAEKIGRHLQR